MTDTDERALALASHLLSVDRPAEALERLAGVSAAALDTERSWVLRVAALLDLDRNSEAESAAKAGLAHVGSSAALLQLLTRARARVGDHAGAERAVLRALSLSPEDVGLLCEYARLLIRVGQVDKAKQVLTQATQLAPESSDVASTRALLAYVAGDSRAATAASRDVLGRDPESALGRTLLAGASAERGDFRTAQRLYAGLAAESADADLRESARVSRAYSRWWLLPLWPIERFGPVPVWLAWLAVVFGLNAAGLDRALIVMIPLYLVYVLYSWVAPPLVQRWARR